MRKWLSMAMSFSLLVSSLFVLASAAGAASKFNIAEDPEIAARVQAFADIKALFTDNTDLKEVQAYYVSKFQTETKRIDATIKADDPKIDENITFVLNNAVKGDLNVNQAKQAVDKGLQWYFFFALRDLISNTVRPALNQGDYAAATKGFDKVVQIYEGVLQSTVTKRDASYGLDMVGILKGTIEQLQQDLADKNVNDFNIHRQVLDKLLIKTYALATNTYASSIATKPAADQPAAVTEGYFLYLPVYTYLRGGSVEDANDVLDAFASGDAGQIDGNRIKLALQRTMIGKVSEYVNNAFVKLAAGDLQGARGYAMEGTMFLSTQEPFFTKEAYAAAASYAQQFVEAVDQANLQAAEAAGFQMLKYIVPVDGIELAIGDKTYRVDGQAHTAVSEPYISKETGRTLVPVRLIADAIGAEVSYDGNTSTVRIVKDGATTELKVGSSTIVQNGKTNETVALDQPVVIKDDSSFIPLRAVAELFGKGVFYDKGNIIILR
ncbi:copper amine oxidase N-terminal domain-containing protein [Paenibacillus cymbidii]|uniref:copper amine oxidase N-terminal domain-containing protein n=1 Tax=Paenibacillus cymbidii TaxID=1639034 RepID=UPI0010822607|nr:copper amine oxidase N-terminal domain-containing protein [Paenibacillus cymbidii]